MRNILITVMMIIVVALLFTSIVGGAGGIRTNIQTHGTTANTDIRNLAP
jgi:hypothetical protein